MFNHLHSNENNIVEDKTNEARSSIVLSVVVLLGKVLGFVKQSLIAWAFGANSLTDVYFAAEGYVSVFGQIMTQTVGATVVTQYVEVNSKSKKEGDRLIQNSYLFFACVSLAVIFLNILCSNTICHLIGMAYSDEQLVLMRGILISALPVILFTAIAGVSSGYLDSHNHFLPGRLLSFFFSLSIIASVLLFKEKLGLFALLYALLFGYFLHTVLMLVLVVPKVGIGISNPFKNREFIAMLKRYVPLVIGVSIVDFGHSVDKIIASSLPTGSVSALYYGQIVSSDLIYAVIISSVGSVLLTSLAKSVSANVGKELIKGKIQYMLEAMSFVVLGITALYFVEGNDLVTFLFQRGEFDSSSTQAVTSVALCYSLGFVFSANRDILVKAHYAFKDTKAPMINSLLCVAFNVVFSIVLAKRIGVSGVALATSLSLLFGFILSSLTLQKHLEGNILNRTFLIDFLKSLISFCIAILLGKRLSVVFGDMQYLLRMVLTASSMVVIHCAIGALMREKAVATICKKWKYRFEP